MKIWTQEEEAKNLANLFAGKNRAAFAREFKVPGGQTMIYQHIKGLRPISLEAALCYAAGFGCGLEQISPRLAQEVARASQATAGEVPVATTSEWPFSIEIERYKQLSADKKKQLDVLVKAFVLGATPSEQGNRKEGG